MEVAGRGAAVLDIRTLPPTHSLMPGLVFLQEARGPGDPSVVRAQRG